MMLTLLLLIAAAQAPAPTNRTSAQGASQARPSAPVALAELESLTARNPTDPKGWVLLGLAYLDRNDPRALETFQRAVKVGPDSAEAHNWLGVALATKSDLPGAILEFRKAVELDPKYGRAYSNLGSTLAQSGDYTEAVKVFRQALAIEPNNVGAHLNLGTALRETGDLDGALEHLRNVADADPDNASVQYELGQTLGQSSDVSGAIAAYERALAIDPEMRAGYYALGNALKQQSRGARKSAASSPSPADDLFRQAQDALGHGDLGRAREQLEQALRRDDRHAEAHTLLGFTLGQQGELSAAIRQLERAIVLRPDSPDSHYHLGVALWYSGAKDRAVTELQKSVALDPADGDGYAFLGTVLRERGEPNAARVNLQRAIALLPSSASAYIDLGITYLAAGQLDHAVGQLEAGLNVPSPPPPAPDWNRAVAALRTSLSSDAGPAPKDADAAADRARTDRAEAYNILGRLLGRAGATSSDVASAFREAIRLRPEYAEAQNNLGLVLIQSGDDPNGIAALREAVRLAPDYADAHANLGAALTPTDADEAIRELERAVALAPTSVKAQFNLATAYGSSSTRGSAKEIEQLRKVIDLEPTFAKAHFALGKALVTDGKVTDGIAALQEAARLDPASGETHYQLGLALARAGRKDEAAAELQKGRELSSADDRTRNAALDIAEGRAALDRGAPDQAIEKFRHAAQLQPDSADAHQFLGAALEKAGDTEGAVAAYRKTLELNPGSTLAKERLDALTPAITSTGADDPKRVAELEGYIRDGKFAEVEALLAAYVKERPSSTWGWYALGYSQFGQQKIGESIRALSKSLELDIRNAEAHKILGRDLMIIGRFDAAQIEFAQAIRYKPDSAESYYNLGKLFSVQDNWEPARKAFESALQIDPAYVEAMDALGFALEALGEDEHAVATYEKAIALNDARHGTYALPHVNLSAYYNKTGDPVQALEHAQRALALDAKSDGALFQQGRAFDRQGKYDEAVRSLNDAIAINPRASSYYYVLAGVYRRLGRMEESRKALEVFQKLERESSDLEKKRRATVTGRG